MAGVIVVGAGPIGLATAMLLAKDGHEVVVLEKDAAAAPASADEAWESWERRGVVQFRSAHYMQAKFRHVLDAELPEVRDEIEASGGTRHSVVGGFAYTINDPTPRPGDERFETITARRPVIDAAFARVAEDTPGVKINRGVGVDAPIPNGSANVPHVIGIRTTEGEELRADLVVDARGRRSNLGDWITAIGGRAPYEEASDAGFTYYTRHYRSRDGSLPEARGSYFTLLGTFSVITAPTDADTWVVVIVCAAGDMPLKAVRRPDVWERVVRSVPHVAHWLDGDPVQEISAMAGVLDRYRRLVVDDEPVVTGLVAVGDSWACTNPQAGRGVSTGLRHAVALRNVAREHMDDPRKLARAFDEATELECTPWYRMQVARDRLRYAAVKAEIEGRDRPDVTDPAARMQEAFTTAAAYDADVARASLEVFSCLTLPQDVLARPGMIDRVMTLAQAHEPPVIEGPTRAELVALVTG